MVLSYQRLNTLSHELHDECLLFLIAPKTGGAPNIYRQYTQKIKPSTRKGRKNLEKSRLATIKSIQKIQKRGIFQIFKNC